MRPLLCLLVCICTLSTPLGCDPTTCDGRGESTPVTGIISYVRGKEAGTLVAGSIDIFDYNQSCLYDGEEFPITVGSCTLWATLQSGPIPSVRYGSTASLGTDSGWASIDAGQTCDLPVLGGVARITVTDGAVTFSDSTTTLFLSGNDVEWQFQANGVPQ